MNTKTLHKCVSEVSNYLLVCDSMGLQPDPLCPVMVALRDAMNLLPALPAKEVARRNAGVLSVSEPKWPELDGAYDETDRTAHLGEFPR